MSSLFAGLPAAVQVLFWLALVVIVAVDAWVALLFVRGIRSARGAPLAARGAADEFVWVFLVPALDEELTIADSVTRLLELPVASKHVVVIDDGSSDSTQAILAGLAQPGLHILRREPPAARLGKAAALNHAYRALGGLLGTVDRGRVIVTIVDADGRLSAEAPRFAAAQFADPFVGGVQSLVRIYNRGRLLTWCQDVEFSVYGHLFQAGRNGWGTAGMGGNGQFNRLASLDGIAGAEGPWRDRLTEDQDVGLRLIVAGWGGRQDLRATVEQQGLSSLRRLFRQRVRWSQGNLQAVGLSGAIMRAPLSFGVRLEQVAYLLMPLWQAVIGASFVTAVVLAVLGVAPFWDGGPGWALLLFYLLGFGGAILGCVASRVSEGPLGWLRGFLVANVYALYTWLLWPVLVRAILRQVVRRRDWAKTAREPLDTRAAPARHA